jgi:hypothetical protein
MTNTLPDNTHPCPDCTNSFGESTGFVSRHHWNEDTGTRKPPECPSCAGRGYVFDSVDSPVHSAADDLTALLTDLRDLLWRYRDFCPEAVELRIRCGEVLDMLGDAKEVKVR